MRRFTSILLFLLATPIFFSMAPKVHAASLDFYVRNANGNPVTDGNAHVKRYSTDWNLLDEVYTDSAGKATFPDVNIGTYNFEVYYDGAGGTEYWGDVQVIFTGTASYWFTRFMPFCEDVWIGDTSGTERTDFSVGETVRAKFTIRNNVYFDLRVKVRAVWDIEQVEPFNFDQESGFSSISGQGGTVVITMDYGIPEEAAPGSMRLAYWISTELLNTNVIVTDSWVWTTYVISITGTGPRPDKSFIVLQFDAESDDEDLASGYVSSSTLTTIHNIGNLLDSYNLPATFFVQGACFDNEISGGTFKDEVQLRATNHEIGTHYYSHFEGMSKMSAEQVAKELRDTEDSSGMELLGGRVPYFDFSDTIFNQLAIRGYTYDSSIWSGGDNTPYLLQLDSGTLYELPWRCSDYDTAYPLIGQVVDEYVVKKFNMTIVFHPQYVAEDWAGFSQLIATIANYRDADEIIVMTSLEIINLIFELEEPIDVTSNAEVEGVFLSSTVLERGDLVTVTVQIKNNGDEQDTFYVGGSIIGEGENTWKDLSGWGFTDAINPSASIAFVFEEYVMPSDASFGFHGILVKIWSDESQTELLAEEWFPEMLNVELSILGDLDKKIKLVFSPSESYYPVPGLYYDGDQNIANNYQNYRINSAGSYLMDRNNDGYQDAPAYVYVKEDSQYYVVEYWIYYAYNSKQFSEHEHDFEYVFLWVDKSSGEIKRLALNQHMWTNNYEFNGDPGVLYLGVEEGGHGMILLNADSNNDGLPDDQNGDGYFDVRKPDNCRYLSPELLQKVDDYNQFSEIVSLYPWRIYDGGVAIEGFGEANTLITGANYEIVDPLVILGLREAQFYLDAIDKAYNTPLLLDSNNPWTLDLVVTSISFYIQAPWTRAVFHDPELQWNKVSFEWWTVKASAKLAATILVNKLATDILLRILIGSLANQALLGIFDPVEASIIDNQGRVLGYKEGVLVSEIPGGVIFSEGTNLDIYFIADVKDDCDFEIRTTDSTNYNFTISKVSADGHVSEFNTHLIPLNQNTVHKYTIDWTIIEEGGDGVVLYVDNDGDGEYEKIINSDSNLEGSELEPSFPEEDNLILRIFFEQPLIPLLIIVGVASVIAVAIVLRKSKNRN